MITVQKGNIEPIHIVIHNIEAIQTKGITLTHTICKNNLLIILDKEVEFINVFPSTTIILRYNYTAITVDWTGPNHDNMDNNGFISEEKETDTHSIKKKWNVTTYTNNGHFNPILSHKKRLKIVGDDMRGQFFLQIENVSIYDVGLYRCHILSEDSNIFLKSFIIQIKRKYFTKLLFIKLTELEKKKEIPIK